MLVVYWNGQIKTENVDWQLLSDSEIVLSEDLELKREKIWQKIVNQYPKAYDGMLLRLNSFSVKEERLGLKMSCISFSRVQTLLKSNVRLEPYGVLGVQAIILSPDKRYLLYGERSKDHMHCPQFLGSPGGMLSINDAENPFWLACMREITEEAHIALREEKFLIAISADRYTPVGTVLLLLTFTEEQPDVTKPVPGNDEWTNRELHWHPVETLPALDNSKILEGLVFVKKDWQQFNSTGKSVIW